MKYIVCPNNVTIANPITKQPEPGVPEKTFLEHVVGCWLSDERLGSSPKDLLRVGKMLDGVTSIKPGEVWALEDSDYDKLRAVVDDPKNKYATPLLNLQVLSFSQAFLDASETQTP
jgi:hypothetical protein